MIGRNHTAVERTSAGAPVKRSPALLYTAGVGDSWSLAVVIVPRLGVLSAASGRWADEGPDKQRCVADSTADPVYPRWGNIEVVGGLNGG